MSGNRHGSRPLLPSRATYLLPFGVAAILVFGMIAYLMWAHARGLLSWHELRAVEGDFIVIGSIGFALGILLRRRWLRKRDAVRAYERMLSSIASTGNG